MGSETSSKKKYLFIGIGVVVVIGIALGLYFGLRKSSTEGTGGTTKPTDVVNKWVYSDWSTCTADCGGGTATRTGKCAGNCTGLASSCTSTDGLNATCSIPCNTQSCDWTYTPWSDCSSSCGGGVKTRFAKCNTPSGCDPSTLASGCAISDTGDYICTTTEGCSTTPCVAPHWDIGTWEAP